MRCQGVPTLRRCVELIGEIPQAQCWRPFFIRSIERLITQSLQDHLWFPGGQSNRTSYRMVAYRMHFLGLGKSAWWFELEIFAE